jgi:hypothetical protein
MTLTLKIKRLLIRASSVTAVICTVSLTIQLYLSRWYRSVDPVKIAGSVEDDASSQTVWDFMKQDLNISHFAKLTEDIPGVVDGLTSLKGQFTVYAPTNEAFEREQLPYDTPSFGWMMLVGYHMGFGALSPEALREKTTVPSFLHADRFFKYKQRIRTQPAPDRLTLNFRADVMGFPIVSIEPTPLVPDDMKLTAGRKPPTDIFTISTASSPSRRRWLLSYGIPRSSVRSARV